MKEKRKNSKITFIILSFMFAILIMLVVIKFINNPVNDLRIGWISHEQSNMLTADYSYFTGTEMHNMKGTNTNLNIDVETKKVVWK